MTAHVDFATLADVAQSRGARWLGTVTQGEWLNALGIEARADALAEFAPQHRDSLLSAKERLTADDQMGVLFKVMGLSSPDWPQPVGFE
jgi:NADH dehydrogenase [ubiquinone] 1 alpha subcomplex assembly factor 7